MRRIINAIIAFAILVLIGLGVFELQRFNELEKMNKDIRELVVKVPEKDNLAGADPNDPFERRIDFDALQQINPDIKGWIYIPGTKIDYPILVGNQYLNRDMYGDRSSLGSIFTYESVDIQNDSLVRVYGHNMISKQMFGSIKNYADQEFADKHAVMYLYTPERTKECKIISGFGCRFDDRAFSIVPEDIEKYAQELVNRSVISTDPPDKNWQIYTLGSCRGYSGTPNRFAASFTVIREKVII